MKRTIYRVFLVGCLVGGVVLFIVVPESAVISGRLVTFGATGLFVEQQIDKETLEFQMQLRLRELDEQQRQAEHERQMEKLNLQRPSLPDEAF